MVTRQLIDDFFAQQNLALVRSEPESPKLGADIAQELASKNKKIFIVCLNKKRSGDESWYDNLKSLPEKVGGVIIATPSSQTPDIVKHVHDAGITRVWMQLESESKDAIAFCEENGIKLIYNECVMMYAEPVKSIHAFHRWIWKILGKLPK